MSTISRNSPCPCGSGKRYKHCCGASGNIEASAPPPLRVSLPNLMRKALACQVSGQLADSSVLYEQALEIDPDNFDALHMLGVVAYQLGDAEAGARRILHAIDAAAEEQPPALTNLGLCLAALARKQGLFAAGQDEEDEDNYCHPSFLRRNNLPPLPVDPPGVTVVVPSYNHAHYIKDALHSVFSQSYRNIELIIIDDGSRDESVAVIRETLESCPFPHRFITRENRGAHATLNEGVALARHRWVTVLNSDDRYATHRIEWMLRSLEGRQAAWAYSGVMLLDENSFPVPPGRSARADLLLLGLEDRYRLPALCTGFGIFNHAISTGNLVFLKSLWEQVGGFSSHRYIHDWDFCLRALLRSEPVFVDEPLYLYRIHASNTINESAQKAAAESDQLLASWMERLSSDQPIANETLQRFRSRHLKHDWRLMSEAKGHLVGLPRLKKYASQLGLA
jgi:glycosyltransferase involved in cell wall biosynthesis